MDDVNIETLRGYDMLSQYEAAMVVSDTTDTKSEQFIRAIKRIDRAIYAGKLTSVQAVDCEKERGNRDKSEVLRLAKLLKFSQTYVDEKQTMIRRDDLLKWMLAKDEPVENKVEADKPSIEDTIEGIDIANSELEIAKFNAVKAQAEAEIAKFNADVAKANAAEAKSKEVEAKANAAEAKSKELESKAKAEEEKLKAAGKKIDPREKSKILCILAGLAMELKYLPFNSSSSSRVKNMLDTHLDIDEGTIRKHLRAAQEALYSKME